MSYHHPRQTDQHVAQIYDLIIDQVVEDLTPKLQDEGIDTSVLLSIKQVPFSILWFGDMMSQITGLDECCHHFTALQ